MKTTRMIYLAIVVTSTVLNTLGFLEAAGYFRGLEGIVFAALLFNLILIPLTIPWAYRVGEMAEEEYRRSQPKVDQVAGAANNAQRLGAGGALKSDPSDQRRS